jgi:4'-phosphopantetheinyl transferase
MMTAPAPALVTQIWADCPAPDWPGLDRTPVVLIMRTPDTTLRDEARVLVRTALRSFLAPLAGCVPEMVPLHIEPGEAPRLALAGLPVWLSISHDAGLSLTAVSLGGAIGVDLMRVADAVLPDWQALAHDYLGPDAAAGLEGLSAGERPAAFARAWTRHEAALKCLGRPLREWSPDLAREIGLCRISELMLPDPYCGAVALRD